MSEWNQFIHSVYTELCRECRGIVSWWIGHWCLRIHPRYVGIHPLWYLYVIHCLQFRFHEWILPSGGYLLHSYEYVSHLWWYGKLLRRYRIPECDHCRIWYLFVLYRRIQSRGGQNQGRNLHPGTSRRRDQCWSYIELQGWCRKRYFNITYASESYRIDCWMGRRRYYCSQTNPLLDCTQFLGCLLGWNVVLSHHHGTQCVGHWIGNCLGHTSDIYHWQRTMFDVRGWYQRLPWSR